MAGQKGDIPSSGKDNSESFKHEEAHQEVADNLRAGLYSPTEKGDRTDARAEKWDPKVIDQSTAAIKESIAKIEKLLYQPDEKSGDSLMDRMQKHAPEFAKSVQAQFTTELVEPFKQTSGQIENFMKKLQA